jgi:hypothetical protein
VEFAADRVEEVVAAMATMAAAHGGWVNFEPSIPVEDVPAAGSGAFALFSGRGPAVPLGTWTPPSAPKRGRPEPAMLGLQHGAGSRVKARLAERGHPVPDGWVVVQDYAKKGLVIALPPGTDAGDVVRWLLEAAALLSAIPLTGWRAAVYEPRSNLP